MTNSKMEMLNLLASMNHKVTPDTEDKLQDLALKYLTSDYSLESRNCKAYLTTAVFNNHKRLRRNRQYRYELHREFAELVQSTAKQNYVYDESEVTELRESIVALMPRLTEKQQVVLRVLLANPDVKNTELAVIAGMHYETFKTTLRFVKQKVVENYKAYIACRSL